MEDNEKVFSVTYEIVCIPDITLIKNRIGSTGGLGGLLELHNSFLRIWNKKCLMSNASLHLFYEYIPSEDDRSEEIKCFIMIRSNSKIEEDTVRLFESHPLIKKYRVNRVQDFENEVSEKKKYCKCSVLMKNEVFTMELEDDDSQMKYTIPNWEVNDAAHLYEMFTVMKAIKKKSLYRVDLYPVDYAINLRNVIQTIKHTLNSNTDKNDFYSSKNREISKVIESYENVVGKVEKSPHYIMNVFSFADTDGDSKIVLDSVCAEALREGSYKVITFDGKYDALSWLKFEDCDCVKSKRDNNSSLIHIIQKGEKGWKVCRDIAKNFTLNFLPVLFVQKEIIPFFRLPIVDDGEDVPIKMDSEFTPEESQNTIKIGKNKKELMLKYPIELLNKHAFICGVPGSGKTYTMLHMVTELHKNKIPFMVMEPAKKEYRAIYNYGKEMFDIMLFSPHMNTLFPLRVNMMEFPEGITLSEHINVLMNVFESTFELGGPVYNLLDKSIGLAYEKYGWNEYNENDGSKEYPCLEELRDIFTEQVEKTTYNGNFKGDLKSFLNVRLEGLMRRDAGEVFNVKKSTIKPEDWISKSSIIEMEDMGEKNRNFLTLSLCNYIREELKIIKKKNADDANKNPNHVIFIEEAHNVIANTAEQSGSNINPKISATKFIVDMLAEVRALRESIVIADQLPSSMAQEVMKNTGLKIALRMSSQDEREYISSTISASPVQIDNLSRYEKGKSLVFFEKMEKAMEVQICKWEGDDNPKSDEELANQMFKSTISAYKKQIIDLNEEIQLSQFLLIQQNRKIQKMLDTINDDVIENYKSMYKLDGPEVGQVRKKCDEQLSEIKQMEESKKINNKKMDKAYSDRALLRNIINDFEKEN